MTTLLATDMAVDRTTGLDELAEFTRTLKGMGALDGLDTAGFQDALAPLGQDAVGIVNTAWAGLVATNGDDVMNGTSDNGHTLRGLGGNDGLIGDMQAKINAWLSGTVNRIERVRFGNSIIVWGGVLA